MINLCPQRGCDATYDLDYSDVGRTLRCRKCGSLLEVEERGLRLVSSGDQPEPTREAVPVRPLEEPGRPRMSSPFQRPSLTNAVTIFSTVLFTTGALLVILFLFLPVIDQTAITRQRALIKTGDAREKERRDERALKGGPGGDSTSWDKRKASLESDLDEARTAAERSHYGYSIGMMFGFLLLAAGSIGYLAPSQSTPRKVVGAVVITAQMVLVFVIYFIMSIRAQAVSF
jgi:hypothetical protein